MRRVCLFMCLCMGLTAGAGAGLPPDQLVRETAEQVITELTENRRELEKNPERLYRMVNKIVLPYFDFKRMSRYVLGQHWSDASPAQREQFTGEFKTLLIRTYATALFEYTGQEIVYKPFRHEKGDKRAVVGTEVHPEDGPPIPIEYGLISNSEEWKVYDIRIDGLSLVTNYRAQYGRIVQTRGIEKLLASLSEKNEKSMSRQ
ncbi:MAG: putative phospholipid-binding protein MlaC [Gammaproteobacteria bacterium]|nr:putative phospholipid-binding protein MlaC [Gammaproteobacteria bacterium]